MCVYGETKEEDQGEEVVDHHSGEHLKEDGEDQGGRRIFREGEGCGGRWGN